MAWYHLTFSNKGRAIMKQDEISNGIRKGYCNRNLKPAYFVQVIIFLYAIARYIISL